MELIQQLFSELGLGLYATVDTPKGITMILIGIIVTASVFYILVIRSRDERTSFKRLFGEFVGLLLINALCWFVGLVVLGVLIVMIPFLTVVVSLGLIVATALFLTQKKK